MKGDQKGSQSQMAMPFLQPSYMFELHEEGEEPGDELKEASSCMLNKSHYSHIYTVPQR